MLCIFETVSNCVSISRFINMDHLAATRKQLKIPEKRSVNHVRHRILLLLVSSIRIGGSRSGTDMAFNLIKKTYLFCQSEVIGFFQPESVHSLHIAMKTVVLWKLWKNEVGKG